MAAIGNIRKHSTLLLIFVGVALLAFIVGDRAASGFRSGQSWVEKFIVVGKEHLTYERYMSDYNARKELIKERAEHTLTPEEDFQINEQLYNELIDSLLFAIQGQTLTHSLFSFSTTYSTHLIFIFFNINDTKYSLKGSCL